MFQYTVDASKFHLYTTFVSGLIDLFGLFPHFSGDIGGSMGLFLGCSLLTIFEFFDFLISVLTRRRHRRFPHPMSVEEAPKNQ